MIDTLNIKTYIITHSEMVSTLGPFRRFLTKIFRIPERKGSYYTVTIALKTKKLPEIESLLHNYLVDGYGTPWRVLDVDSNRGTLKVQNVNPIYGFNKKNMYSLKRIS